jgi:chromosome segregation ATPase
MNKEFEEAKTTLIQRIKELEGITFSLEGELQYTVAQKAELDAKLSRLSEELESTTLSLNEKEKSNLALKELLDQSTLKIDDLNMQIGNLNNRKDELTAELSKQKELILFINKLSAEHAANASASTSTSTSTAGQSTAY